MKKSILFKNLILASLCFLHILACTNGSNDPNNPIDYSVAETQLHKDYVGNTITGLKWSTQRGYQIANFTTSSKSLKKSNGNSITAWYSVSDETATREMDLENLGTTVPDSIKAAFDNTKYNNTALWTIKEIELEHNYGATTKSYYEIELKNVANSKLEAELFFSTAATGELLFSKEELDDDDDDDDKFVINQQLRDAVELAVPGAQIIDAEVDDNIIEVEAIAILYGENNEIEFEFSMDYELISMVTEKEYIYTSESLAPEYFDVINNWFTANSATTPPPPDPDNTIVTFVVDSTSKYDLEIEIDDYTVNSKEYEVEFYMGGIGFTHLEIAAVFVNGEEVK